MVEPVSVDEAYLEFEFIENFSSDEKKCTNIEQSNSREDNVNVVVNIVDYAKQIAIELKDLIFQYTSCTARYKI